MAAGCQVSVSAIRYVYPFPLCIGKVTKFNCGENFSLVLGKKSFLFFWKTTDWLTDDVYSQKIMRRDKLLHIV